MTTPHFNQRHGHAVGGTTSPTYRSWKAMRDRCLLPSHPAHERYHALWHEPWRDFAVFLADMGERPSLQHTLERTDNAKGYGPDNCIWARMTTQSRNRPTSKLTWEIACAIRASSETPVQLAKRYGVHRASIHNVLKNRVWRTEE